MALPHYSIPQGVTTALEGSGKVTASLSVDRWWKKDLMYRKSCMAVATAGRRLVFFLEFKSPSQAQERWKSGLRSGQMYYEAIG